MLLPACTGFGVFVLVIERFAEPLTMVVTVTALLLEFGSVVVELTVAVSAIDVPEAVVAGTDNVNTKLVVVVPELRFPPSVQVGGEVVVQVHPVGMLVQVTTMPAGVVGMVSTSLGVVAAPFPLLVTVCVKVIVPPAVTGFGLPTFVALRSASLLAVIPMVTLAELLDVLVSCVEVPTVMVSVALLSAVLPLS
jgi:hypothetical protein